MKELHSRTRISAGQVPRCMRNLLTLRQCKMKIYQTRCDGSHWVFFKAGRTPLTVGFPATVKGLRCEFISSMEAATKYTSFILFYILSCNVYNPPIKLYVSRDTEL